MTRLVAGNLRVVERTTSAVVLRVRPGIRFTEPDLSDGRAGRARFRLTCTIWDDDFLFDNRVARASRDLSPAEIRTLSVIRIPFTLSYARLREKETGAERMIELFGEFGLSRDGVRLGPSVRTPTVDVSLVPPPASAAIAARIETTPSGPTLQVLGAGFAANAALRVRWTDFATTNSATISADAHGAFAFTVPVRCEPGLRFAVIANDVANPAISAMDSAGAVCPP